MATTFYKLQEGDKLYRIDHIYDDGNNLIEYERHNLVMFHPASIENYKVRFICNDTSYNKNIMFTRDVGHNSWCYRDYTDDNNKFVKMYLTTSKKDADNYCKRLDEELNINNCNETEHIEG